MAILYAYHFDFESNTIFSVIDYIITLNITSEGAIHFRSWQGGNPASGNGASRQVYQKLGFDIIREGLMVQSGYFANINTQHPFWTDAKRIQAFGFLLKCFVIYDCPLPFHLAPSLLEAVSRRTMKTADLAFYAEKTDPDVYKLMSEADLSDLGFDSTEAAYRHACKLDDVSDELIFIYRAISLYLHLDESIQHADRKISGEYLITPEMIQNRFVVNGSTSDVMLWKEFVQSLSDTEIRSMLRIIGNTVSLNNTYRINICNMSDRHINISTCAQQVTIHIDLFQSIDTLNMLKMYFEAGDEKIHG